ncbi:MAG: hypothetical protein JWO22_2672 [Frankiales bacterium]|nr:hypothetical protein [Frankiales bacterium]
MPALTLIGVYRERNAACMLAIARQAMALGAEVRLHALGEVERSLARWTVAQGAGGRCTLLNELYLGAQPTGDVVVSDDDVDFCRGDLARFLTHFHEGGWDLAQPAHPWRGSHSSYRFFLKRRPWLVSRDTTFVEIGPLFAVAERARDAFLPLPEWGMGWGVELLWWDRARAGARLGMVDDVTIRHLSPLYGDYGRADEERRLRDQLALRDLRHIRQTQRTLRSTPRWQRLRPRGAS